MLLVKGLIESAPSEEALLTGAGDGAVKVWRLGHEAGAAPTQIAKLQNGDSVLSIAVEGSLLYCGLAGGALNIWNLDSHQLVKRIAQHTGDLWAVHVIQGVAICGDSTGTVKVSRTITIQDLCCADVARNSTLVSRRLVVGLPTKVPCLPRPPAGLRTGRSTRREAMTILLGSGI